MFLKKITNSAAYRTIILGQGSNRDEHTEISRNLADLFCLPGFFFGISLSIITQDYRYSFLCFTQFFIWTAEHWCTCDNDIRYKVTKDYDRKMYWSQYAKTIPRHRHPYSHSILPGSFYRVVYGYAPIWMIVLQTGYWREVLPILGVILFSQVINDIGHLSADGYRPWEWTFGRYSKKELTKR